VPTPLFDNGRLLATSHSFTAPQMQMSNNASSLARAHFVRSEGLRVETGWAAKPIADLRRLGKGVSWALAIECTAALGFYFVWHLWHL
jgi:hypothetical protein